MSNPSRIASIAVVCAMAAFALSAAAQQAPGGSAPESSLVTSLAALPAAVRDLISSDLGEISDSGGPFNAGCVMQAGVPSARFMHAKLGQDVATVAVERGGIAHYVETLEFQQANGSWKLVRTANGEIPPPPALALPSVEVKAMPSARGS